MMWSFSILCVCQTAGIALHILLDTHLPAPLITSGLLLAAFACCPHQRWHLVLPPKVALLPYLGLLFTPDFAVAALSLRHVPRAFLPLAIITLIASILAFAAAAVVAQQILRRGGRPDDAPTGLVSPPPARHSQTLPRQPDDALRLPLSYDALGLQLISPSHTML